MCIIPYMENNNYIIGSVYIYIYIYIYIITIYEGWNFNSGDYLFTTDTK